MSAPIATDCTAGASTGAFAAGTGAVGATGACSAAGTGAGASAAGSAASAAGATGAGSAAGTGAGATGASTAGTGDGASAAPDLVVRPGTFADAPFMPPIYATARAFMRATGNADQWTFEYPTREIFEGDVAAGTAFVGVDADDVPHLVFHLGFYADPTYGFIDGAWPNDVPYAVIHRIASDGTRHGTFGTALAFAREECARRGVTEIRVDTHADNAPMHRIMAKYGFELCGVIYLENGDPRTAYHLSL